LDLPRCDQKLSYDAVNARKWLQPVENHALTQNVRLKADERHLRARASHKIAIQTAIKKVGVRQQGGDRGLSQEVESA